MSVGLYMDVQVPAAISRAAAPAWRGRAGRADPFSRRFDTSMIRKGAASVSFEMKSRPVIATSGLGLGQVLLKS